MSANPMVIPTEQRYGKLKDLLLKYVEVVAKICDQSPQLAREFPSFFLFLSFAWVADPAFFSVAPGDFFERRKREIEALGFDGEGTKRELEAVLANDKHLAACCPTVLNLVNFLDTFFISPTADAKRQGVTRERLEFAYAEFESLAYHQGPFKRIALSHLFNFDMEDNSVIFEGGTAAQNIRIERI